MNIQKLFVKKLERKDFFISAGVGLVGLFVMRMFPFNLLLNRKHKSKEKPLRATVRINPLAISRNKLGDNNG